MYPIKNPKFMAKLTLVGVLLTCYDMLWDLFLSALHALLVLAHYLFEFCESSLDVFVEHLFHTTPRVTEIIVFYIMAGIIGLISFLLLRALPGWYCKICEMLTNYYFQEKTKAITFWHQQTVQIKVKWCSLFMVSSFFMLFFVFS